MPLLITLQALEHVVYESQEQLHDRALGSA